MKRSRSQFARIALVVVSLGIALFLVFGGDHDLIVESALARDSGDTLAESAARQGTLSLPGFEVEAAPVPRTVVPLPVTSKVAAVQDAEVTDSPESAPTASILGYVSFHRDHPPRNVYVTVIGVDSAAGNLRVYKNISVHPEAGIYDGVHETFPWEVEGLIPGEYRITYDGNSIQGVTLVPGKNDIFAVMGEPQNLVLSFVDGLTGEPVLGSRVHWANQVDGQWPGTLWGRSAHFRDQNLHCLNGTGRVRGVLTERFFIQVFTKGYATLTSTLFVSDGEKQTVALQPICQLQITKLSEGDGDSMSLQELALGLQFSLSIGGQLYTPVSGGSRGTELYATYDIPTTRAGDWKLILPDGLELVELDNCPAGPGQTINVTVR